MWTIDQRTDRSREQQEPNLVYAGFDSHHDGVTEHLSIFGQCFPGLKSGLILKVHPVTRRRHLSTCHQYVKLVHSNTPQTPVASLVGLRLFWALNHKHHPTLTQGSNSLSVLWFQGVQIHWLSALDHRQHNRQMQLPGLKSEANDEAVLNSMWFHSQTHSLHLISKYQYCDCKQVQSFHRWFVSRVDQLSPVTNNFYTLVTDSTLKDLNHQKSAATMSDFT